ncbi:hypothetical protein DVA81_19585, partial [Acinetobacter baumannii]
LRKKLIMFLISPVFQSSWKERSKNQTKNGGRSSEGMGRDEGKREENRDREEWRGIKRLRQKAWIAEIRLDHCLPLWMRLF